MTLKSYPLNPYHEFNTTLMDGMMYVTDDGESVVVTARFKRANVFRPEVFTWDLESELKTFIDSRKTDEDKKV